ncbi:MAG TPA: tetratricopeptide repeat protein [Methylomirabilota bacterium]
MSAVALLLAALALLAGCATSSLQGRAALGRGSYSDAARHFEEALAHQPGRAADLLGLGIARYKLDALDEAQRALEEARAQAPDLPPVHLYLALIAIRRGDPAADAHLAAYRALGPPPRLVAQVDRTRRVLADPVTPELRSYAAASLEDAYQWAGEVAGALQAAREAELRYLADERIYWLPRYCRCR